MEDEVVVVCYSAFGPLLVFVLGIHLWLLIDREMVLCRRSKEIVNGMKWRGVKVTMRGRHHRLSMTTSWILKHHCVGNRVAESWKWFNDWLTL